MIIYLNREPVHGPWGGGNKLVSALSDHFIRLGHHVVYELNQPADVYICFDPRPNRHGDDATTVLRACLQTRAGGRITKFVCRVGDVGTHGKPQLTRMWAGILQYADLIIFPSEWARSYMKNYAKNMLLGLNQHIDSTSCIIFNGALATFAQHSRHTTPPNPAEKIRVVTHHWSNNALKGFNLYSAIDAADEFDFTYIGRAPDDVKFKHHISAMSADQLAIELPRHDVYVTASKYEAGANHVLEAIAAGLPVAYSRSGGSIVEYCAGHGVEYDDTAPDAARAIKQCVADYTTIAENRAVRDMYDVVVEYAKVII